MGTSSTSSLQQVVDFIFGFPLKSARGTTHHRLMNADILYPGSQYTTDVDKECPLNPQLMFRPFVDKIFQIGLYLGPSTYPPGALLELAILHKTVTLDASNEVDL